MLAPRSMPEKHASDDARPLFPSMEAEVRAAWKKDRIFARSLEERSPEKTYVFYDGPPFATGLPHYGHLLQSALKDAIPRYWTMKGYRVPRRWGWDCHGLPVENLIEKKLSLASKREIEAFGVDKFNEACRMSVLQYASDWEEYVDRLGRWVDYTDSYKTMDNTFVESVWWVFSELHKNGYIYKGTRVSLYCPRCATPLSNFEIAMGNSYEDKQDPAVYVKFPVKGEPKTYFLAWTTTPWTLPANTGLAVHPELTYVAVTLSDTQETLIFAEQRQSDVLKAYAPYTKDGAAFEVVGRFEGAELVGKRYEPLYAFVEVEGDGFRVVTGDHVSAEDGTGIVHTAPAFGEEDFQMMKVHGLPMIESVDEEGRMKPFCGPFAGMRIKEADAPIMEDLVSRGLLHRQGTITHSVPVCWRCATSLLYKAQPAWFVDVTKMKPKLLKTAEKIQWHPEHFKDGRFGKGLETAPDWCISRTRFWGAAIPVWECADCGDRTIVSSMAELREKATPGSVPETLDLHRPVIDGVTLPCPCGKTQSRIKDVFDCWFESGSMPYGSQHYPFENKRAFEGNFPADFIAEGQDQTRGWFYALHVIATGLFNKPAFQNVMVTGLVLAEDGKKMSKSLKNYPDPLEVLNTHGADALRYYLLSTPVVYAESLNFSEKDLQTVVRGFLNLFWNVKTFYATYATSEIRPSKPRSGHVLDRWMFARLHQMIREVTDLMDGYNIAEATRPMRAFVDDLSTWWLRRSRDRIKSENAFEREDALKTLREVLEEAAKVFAPIIPFLTERVYQEIGGSKASVHLESWPKCDERVIDERLLQDMAWVRAVCSMGHEQRAAAKLPVRQALRAVTIRFKDGAEASRMRSQSDLLATVRDELNVEAVELVVEEGLADAWAAAIDTELTPELIEKGQRRECVRQIMNLRKQAGLHPADRVKVVVAVEGAFAEFLARMGDVSKEIKGVLEVVEALSEDQAPTASDLEVGEWTAKVVLEKTS